MFERKTVIIVGAGGSAEFGLPTGKAIFRSLYAENADQRFIADFAEYKIFSGSFAQYIRWSNNVDGKRNFPQLIEKTRESIEDSIDMMAYHNPSMLSLSKHYSTWRIMKEMYRVDERADQWGGNYGFLVSKNTWRKTLVDQDGTLSRNWISSLVKKYIGSSNDCDSVNINSLDIISFNYDNILEDAFLNFLKASERFSEGADKIMPKIYHVYGDFGGICEELSTARVKECADRISYVMEDPDIENIENIRNSISSADNIIILGFAADDRNVEAIGLNGAQAELYAVNFDGNYELDSRFKKLGASTGHVMRGSPSSPMTLARAVEEGIFGLPDT